MIYYCLTYTFPLLERSNLCRKKFIILLYLALSSTCYRCANLFNFLKKILFSAEFKEQHRNSPTAFTRNRKLPFHMLICFIINFVKGSYQSELDRFFQVINRSPFAKRAVSKAAFAKARMKLKFEAFIELNRYLIDGFNVAFQCRTWHGLRLLAIDGTTLTLPRISEIIDHFGVWHGRQGDSCPKARASQLYDPLNKLTINATISPKSTGEREHARQLLSCTLPNALILLDRGYPAFWLFKLILQHQAGFCARICSKWKIVRQFIRSGKKEKIIELKPSTTAIRNCTELGLDFKPMKLRLIRVELDTGEIEILITSLVDKKAYPHDIFRELYHQRWPVEEDYKTMKCRMEIEAFTGQSILSVYQDFYANVFAKNMVAVMAFPVQTALTTAGIKKEYEHQINFTHAITMAKNLVALLFQRTHRTVKSLIQNFMGIMILTTEPIRPGRKYPRYHKKIKKQYYQNYKPIC